MPQEQVKASAQSNKLRAPMVGIDILPDEILALVLSFLPMREAVQTCVLGRRWRHLWRSMHVLRIISGDGLLTPQDVENMNTFVNFFMSLRDCRAPLELCEFKIVGEFDVCEVNPDINIWIQQALLSQARILAVEVALENMGFMLDDAPLISKHLTRLELRLLDLRGKFLDFSSCLTLNSLWIRGCFISTDISSQSLKKLVILDSSFDGGQRQISAPSLVWLELTDNFDTPLLGSMPSLVKAFVRLQYCGSFSNNRSDNCGDNGRWNESCMLLNGLSNAESLELISDGEFICKRDLMRCPIFRNLKTLLLNEWCVEIDFNVLICFLKHTPVLEKLTLHLCQAPENWVEPIGFYIPSEDPIASSTLKIVEIKCREFDERVHQISRMLSIYNTYIEQINIQWSARRSVCKLAMTLLISFMHKLPGYSFQIDKEDQLWY